MTFKFGHGENGRNIHMSRTLGASRVIGWYSDIKKLSFAFIPRRTEGHLFRINGPPRGTPKHSPQPLLLYPPFMPNGYIFLLARGYFTRPFNETNLRAPINNFENHLVRKLFHSNYPSVKYPKVQGVFDEHKIQRFLDESTLFDVSYRVDERKMENDRFKVDPNRERNRRGTTSAFNTLLTVVGSKAQLTSGQFP